MESKTMKSLRSTARNHLHLKIGPSREGRIRIAVLDTGIDLKLDASKSVKGRLDNPIVKKKNFATKIQGSENVEDLDGHGTQVANLILDIVPHADLYIARVCDGENRYGKSREAVPNDGDESNKPQITATPEAVEKASSSTTRERFCSDTD